jgi:UDP-N-acetylglucosamine--N-acetylmuramyl-(pentapeptide) pyrophosphoryl-undecaprenol N-acetylglucosamine transferase
MQVIHISGKTDWPEIEGIRSSLRETLGDQEIFERYKVFPYLHEKMGAALSAADLVVSRAGASILGEFPLFGIPAVLVPYPYAWRYQQLNAEYLAKRGAAIIVKDEYLPDQLLSKIRELMGDSAQRKEMSQAMRKLAKPDAALSIYQLLQNLASNKARRGSEL